MKLLVLTEAPVTAGALRAALPGEDLAAAEVLVVSPAVNESRIAFWVSDSDEAIADAQRRGDDAAAQIDGGAAVEVGESEPLLALQDALATFQADRIVIVGGDDDLLTQAREQFDVPVVVA